MNVQNMIEQVKAHPEADKIGMIVSHLGLVRGHSRDGREHVLAVEVVYDQDQMDVIIHEMKQRPGIIDVLVQVNEGRVELGRELLAVVVAGDLREHVFPVLMETVNRIKASACRKEDIFSFSEGTLEG